MDMKNIVLLIFIITSFVFTHLSAQDSGANWWRNEFVIGTYYDPPIKDISDRNIWWTNYDLARDAGFNLFTGTQQDHKVFGAWADSNRLNNYWELKNHYSSLHFLFYYHWLYSPREINSHTGNDMTFIDSLWENRSNKIDTLRLRKLNGMEIIDEPSDTLAYLSMIRFMGKKMPGDKLFYINLLPIYMETLDTTGIKKYKQYLAKFLHNDTPLQVASYDNYYQSSYFSDNNSDGGYFSNLALMRQMADSASIPFWCVINTCEPRYITGCDSLWQAAYLRLGAFAPLAYGAKGLMYYSYDSLHPNRIRRKMADGNGGWSYVDHFLRLPTDTTEKVFIGHLRDGAKADIAVKRDTNLGDWYIKLSDNIQTDSIDRTLGWYGHSSVILPFLCYRPDLGRDVIAGLYKDGRLFLTDTLSGWTHHITLPEVQQDWWQSLTDKKISSFSLDGSSMNFCIAKPGSGRDTLFIYKNLQMHPADYTHNAPQKIALEQGEHVIQLVRDEGQLYVATRKRDIIMHTPIITDRLRRIYKSGNNYTTQSVTLIYPTNIVADHFWVENTDSLRIYMQPVPVGENKNIYVGSIDWNNSPCRLSVTNFISDAILFYATSLRRYGTQIYDRFGIWDKRVYDEALIDGLGNPTMRYYMAKQNNLYIRDVLSPVILGSEWKGAWHTPYKEHPRAIEFMHRSDTLGGYLKMLDTESDDMLKGMDDNMIAGKFETDSCYYYFFVDKGGEDFSNCEIRLADDGISVGTRRVEALPSLTGEPRQLTSHQNADGTVTFTWDSMLGGELVPIKITK